MCEANSVDEKFTNKSLNRAVKIIELLANNNKPMRLQEIAERTKIPESTILRTLNSLVLYKYVQQDYDTKKYFLTLKFAYIGNLISSRIKIRDIVKPFLVELSEKSRESTCLAIEQNSKAVYIDFVDGPDNLLRTLHLIGRAAPLHCTGVGKNLLLNYSVEMLENYIETNGLIALTKNSISTQEELIQELGKIREQGYAIDDAECEDGVRCIAAPVKDYLGKVIASISITGPSNRLTDDKIEKFKDYVISAAININQRLS